MWKWSACVFSTMCTSSPGDDSAPALFIPVLAVCSVVLSAAFSAVLNTSLISSDAPTWEGLHSSPWFLLEASPISNLSSPSLHTNLRSSGLHLLSFTKTPESPHTLWLSYLCICFPHAHTPSLTKKCSAFKAPGSMSLVLTPLSHLL